MWLLLAIGVIILSLVSTKLIKNYSYWYQKGVRTVSPFYWFGVYNENVVRANASSAILKNIYDKYEGERYVGLYQFTQPILFIRDLEIIKSITVKDFDSFCDHSPFLPEDMDRIWSRNVFAMSSSDGWHDMRAILTSFMTVSKMRIMFPLLQECSKQFLSFLNSTEHVGVIEMKDAYSRLAHDVVARMAFGVSCDSLNKLNEFYAMVKKANDISAMKGLKFLFCTFVPIARKMLNVKLYNEKIIAFMKVFIRESLRIRTEHEIVRPDVINALMEARNYGPISEKSFQMNPNFKNKKINNLKITDDDIISQVLALFFAAVESVSTTFSFVCYELSKNGEVQEKLRHEIRETLSNSNGEITLEVLLSMKYLDSVICETLRLHPPAVLLDRRCVKSYIIDDTKSMHVEKNQWIWIPVGAIQRDPKYYPNPDIFDPDRFNVENKNNLQPFTYFPFGLGPRSCMGKRLAFLELKLVLVDILQTYGFTPIQETKGVVKPINEDEVYPEKMWIKFDRTM